MGTGKKNEKPVQERLGIKTEIWGDRFLGSHVHQSLKKQKKRREKGEELNTIEKRLRGDAKQSPRMKTSNDWKRSL